MKLFLLLLGHDVDDVTVLTPVVVPAADVDQAFWIGNTIAERLGVQVLEEPEEISDSCGNPGKRSGDAGEGC